MKNFLFQNNNNKKKKKNSTNIQLQLVQTFISENNVNKNQLLKLWEL